MNGSQAVPFNPFIEVEAVGLVHLSQFASSGYLYAIIDATDMPSIPQKLEPLGPERAISLFYGTGYQAYYAVAPYLVKIDNTLLAWIGEALDSVPWGVFVVSDQPMNVIFEHCQAQLPAKLVDGEYWLFRYYDPKVLERYLVRNQIPDLKSFFGPVGSFVIASGKNLDGKAFLLSATGPWR